MTSHAQPWHMMSFMSLTSGHGENFGLVDCFIGETPSVAIAMFQTQGATTHVMPLFVALTPDMDMTYPDRTAESGDAGGEGGPDRDRTAREFIANKAMMEPGPGG
jgi:hypothetical protein